MLNVRQDIHGRRNELEAYGEAHPNAYAGLVIEEGPPGTVHVGFTDELERHRQALAELILYDRWLKVFRAQWSLGQLVSLVDAIEDDEQYLNARGVDVGGIGVDVRRNRVWVEVAATADGEHAFPVGRYPAILEVLPISERLHIGVEIGAVIRTPDEFELSVELISSDGIEPAEVSVQETSTEVRLSARSPILPWVSSFKANRQVDRMSVALQRPLADRTIIAIQPGDD